MLLLVKWLLIAKELAENFNPLSHVTEFYEKTNLLITLSYFCKLFWLILAFHLTKQLVQLLSTVINLWWLNFANPKLLTLHHIFINLILQLIVSIRWLKCFRTTDLVKFRETIAEWRSIIAVILIIIFLIIPRCMIALNRWWMI